MGNEQKRAADKRTSMPGTITLSVPSHPKYLYVIRSTLYPLVLDAGFGKKEASKIILAVDEACSNIIKYAYEGDHAKKITLTVTVDAGRIAIQLKDTGKQVDVSTIAPRKLDEVRPGGLGTHFMGTVFDTVEYDTTQGTGTVLTLVKENK
jgi:anti-sigma regulatory factor (Ser/Thr protein kinase)